MAYNGLAIASEAGGVGRALVKGPETSVTAGACNPRFAMHEWVRQGGGLTPTCAHGAWDFVIPADAYPVIPRRSESVWAVEGSVPTVSPGDTAHLHAKFTGNLGPAAQDDNDWHVLWQLQGITTQGTWVPPSMGLNVRHGKLRIGGGGGHPNHSYAGRNHEWSVDLAKYTDGTTYDVQVAVFISPDPAQAWVDVHVNGVQVLNHYRPTSPQGFQPGTIYANQPLLSGRNGLYRGTQNNATIPTYEQRMRIEVLEVS